MAVFGVCLNGMQTFANSAEDCAIMFPAPTFGSAELLRLLKENLPDNWFLSCWPRYSGRNRR